MLAPVLHAFTADALAVHLVHARCPAATGARPQVFQSKDCTVSAAARLPGRRRLTSSATCRTRSPTPSWCCRQASSEGVCACMHVRRGTRVAAQSMLHSACWFWPGREARTLAAAGVRRRWRRRCPPPMPPTPLALATPRAPALHRRKGAPRHTARTGKPGATHLTSHHHSQLPQAEGSPCTQPQLCCATQHACTTPATLELHNETGCRPPERGRHLMAMAASGTLRRRSRRGANAVRPSVSFTWHPLRLLPLTTPYSNRFK